MGRRSRPPRQRPLDYPHRLYHRSVDRRPPTLSALSARHGSCGVLPQEPPAQPARQCGGPRRRNARAAGHSLCDSARCDKGRRLGRTAVHQCAGTARPHRPGHHLSGGAGTARGRCRPGKETSRQDRISQHGDDSGRFQLLRRHPAPFGRPSTHGREQPRQRVFPWQLSEPRTIRRPSPALRPRLQQ